jgi:DinB superfamily
VDDGRPRRRPAPGEWAIIEVVGHLADTEDRALGRVRRMLAEDNPRLEPFDQDALAAQRAYLELNLASELTSLEGLRRQHLAPLEAVDGPGWERAGWHGEHGQLTVELYETWVAAEEVDHLAQIARLL